jgi:hypothetical protein
MDLTALAAFLNAANKATYANRTMPKVAPTRQGSLDYHFEKDGLAYHDTYFGARDFIGAEIVYEDGRPAWGANYFGVVLDDEVNEKDVYDFLRQALMQDQREVIPVRGPALYSADDRLYRFAVDGGLANFSGTEEILFAGKIVYRCLIHGGMIR